MGPKRACAAVYESRDYESTNKKVMRRDLRKCIAGNESRESECAAAYESKGYDSTNKRVVSPQRASS